MAKKNISTALETALVANEPFEYAHLVKFERPFSPKDGEFRTGTDRYVYITDGQRDITYDSNTYRAHGLISVGAFSETTQARATNTTLSVSGELLGTEVTVTGTFATSGVFTATNTIVDGEVLDFVEKGFREGDLVEVKRINNLNFSDGTAVKRFVIRTFTSNNQAIEFARTGSDADDSAFLGSELSSTALTFTLVNQEYLGATLEKGTSAKVSAQVSASSSVTLTAANSKIKIGQLVSGRGIADETIVTSINGTALKLNKTQQNIYAGAELQFTNPSFINREVFIYKAFINPETGAFYGDPILTFKGIIASTSIQENAQASRVQWNLTSHWGDFQQVVGRIGTDEIHRSLDANGISNPNLTIRPEYAGDLGFLHAESSLNTIANYQTSETRYRQKSKKRGGLAGFVGMKKYYIEEYQVQVDNEVDLSVYLQGRYIPVVYGVQRIAGVPVFADTKNNNSKEVYVAYSIAEGEIHGIYNMYIDGAPLICVDKNDLDVRGTSATNSDSQALQCYGRMDKGGTLGGARPTGSDQYHPCRELAAELAREDIGNNESQYHAVQQCYENYTQSVSSSDISGLVVNENAEGLQHEESAKISHPFDMEFTFHSGRPNQKANNLLATVAKTSSPGNFKRQNDYYTGDEEYWGPNHRLLDTAYAVMKFTIEADQTTIPEVEYVVKGSVLECFNYDGSFVYDAVKNASNVTTDFNEGDTVTVEVSSNGTSWSSDGNGNYRILDKYLFTTSRNTSYNRFRLDKLPVLGDNTYLRLKQGSNYWYMLAHDHAIALGGDTIQSQALGVTSMQTSSSGVLSATLNTAGQAAISSIYGSDATSTSSTSKVRIRFIGGTGEFASLENKSLQATYSSNQLTFLGQRFTASQSNITGIEILPDRFLDLSDDLGTYTSAEVVGHTFKNLSTGEEKEIVGYNTSTKRIELESGFAKTPLTTHKYTISGKGKDLRASTNPAIQTLDLLTNERYGKGLSVTNDIDIASVKAAAQKCDTRSDITIPLSSATTCVEGDVYKLTANGQSSGDHVASGKIKTSTSSESTVTLTDISGKFTRSYFNYITYRVGDIVTHVVNDETKYYRVTDASAANAGNAPIHGSGGTANGFQHLTTGVTLHRVSGSGPTTLTLGVDNRAIKYSLYDSDFVKYWRYLGWEENRQWCVTRHQTNFIFATEKSIFENINALLSHYNGILSYSNGKYVLDVETAEVAPTTTNTFNSVTYDWNVNPEFIDNSDIIGGITINDNAQKNAKNTIKASISDPQNNFSSRSVSFFNSDFLKADRGVIKTGNYPVTGITSYYNARIGIEKELIQSRYSKEISFTVGQKGLLLKPGAVIAITYDPFDFSSKLFRIENLTHNANCTTSIKAREYDDEIYAISPQVANFAQFPTTTGDHGLALPGTPASLTTTNTKPGVITLNWNNASDYKEVIDSTEIWRASSQGSSGDITSHATLLAVVDNATTFSDAVGSAGTFYYWIRHRRMSRRTSDNAAVKLVGSFSTTITNGVSGVAKVPSAQLDVDVASAQIKFNASNALTPGGTNQDVKLTATLRGITANNVTFTLVDSDASTTATDVTFTNSNASVVDSSAPYEATIDASSFSHNTENKFVKVTCTDTASSEVFTELIPIAVVKDGSSGSVGIDAKAIKLTPSTHVVSYSATGGESTTVTFTTETQGTSGFSGTANYQFLVGGVLKATNTTGTFTLADSDEPASNASVNVVVKLFDGTPSGSPEATDSVTIFGVKDGSDAISTFLTNAAHVVPTNNAGAIDSSLVSSGDITSAGGTFKVFIGATDRTTACTYAVQSESGVDATIGANTGAYTISSTGLSDLGTATFRVTIPSNVSPTGTQLTIDRVYSIAKSKQGTAGAGGTDAKTVQLTAADYSVVYDEDGANPSPSGTITLTASHQNFSNPVYQFVIDGTAGSFGTSATGSFSVPSSIFNTPKTMQVNVKESGASSVEAFDSISIFGVKSGANAFTVILNNEAHAIPADSNGANPVLTGSGCTITAFKGSTELNGITSGTPTTGQFKVTVSSDTNITVGSQTSSGNPVVFADHSALTAATANIVYSINLENTQTVLKQQTFTRVDKGDDSRNSAEVKIYKRSNNSSATANEAVPNNSTTYTFSTGAWPGSGNEADGWSLTQPTSGGFYMWSATARAVGNPGADTATIAASDWATPTRSVVEDPRVAQVTIFYDAWSYGSAPANPSISQGSFNFTTGAFTALPSGWSNTIGSLPYYQVDVIITEATFGGTQTYTFVRGRGNGEWRDRDPRDIVVEMDDSAHEVRVRAGSDLAYTASQKASIPAKYKNDEISFTFSETAIELTKYSGETLSRNTPSTLKNSQITTKADGTLNYNGTPAVAPSLASLAGIVPVTKGGFGVAAGSLFGNTAGRFPRWNGSAFEDFAEANILNTQILDGNGNIKDSIGLALPSSGGTFTPAEFKNVRESFDNIGNSGTIKLQATKVPFDDNTIGQSGGNLILKDNAVSAAKLATSIAYTGSITAGAQTNVAGLDGTGTGDSTVRIFAGSALSGKTDAPFRVTQGGEVNVTSLNVNTGTSNTTVRFKPNDPSNVFFAVGDDDPTDAPLRVKNVSGTSQVEIDNLKLFKSDGTTLMFDSATGFTDAAFTQIAANVGSSTTGSTVTTVDNSNLINPFTDITNQTGTNSATGKDRFQKITLSTTTTLNITAKKSANFFKTGSTLSDVLSKIPTRVQMRLMYSTNENLTSPVTVATLGSSFSNGITRVVNTATTSGQNQYRITTVTESEPGFQITIGNRAGESTDFNAGANDIEIGNSSLQLSSGTYYFFIEIDGDGATGQTTGPEAVNSNAPRELTISSNVPFSVDSDGNIQPSGSSSVTSVTAGTGLSGGGTGGSVSLALDLSELNQSTSNADGDEFVVLDTSGNEKRLVKGNINLSGFNNDLTSFGSGISVTGAIQATGDVIAFHSSDYRLKNNINTIENALDKVDQMRGVEFDWNDKQDSWEGHDIGVIAQEVEKVVPEIVIEREDGYKAVNYQKLTALLVQAVKELKEEIKELKKDK